MEVKNVIKAAMFAMMQAFIWIVLPLFSLSETLNIIDSFEEPMKGVLHNLIVPNIANMTFAFLVAGFLLVVASILKSMFKSYELPNLIGKLLSYFSGLYIAIAILSLGDALNFGKAVLIGGTSSIGITLILNFQIFALLLTIVFILKAVNAVLQFSVSREELTQKEKVVVL